jgi:hypothetical protein
MKVKKEGFVVLVLILLVIIAFGSTNVYAADDCYDADVNPIPICTCVDINKTRDKLNSNYSMQNDVDCSDTINWDAGKGFWPIGNNTHRFTGDFDGQNFEVSNLFINRTTNNVGLFGFIDAANITNIGVVDADVRGSENTGILIGFSIDADDLINNSYSTGNVSGADQTGGFIGITYGTVTYSYTTANATGSGSDAGGFIGYVGEEGKVRYSYSAGYVSGGGQNVGGFIGRTYGAISNSYARTNVSRTGSSTNQAGFVGHIQVTGSVTKSYSTGNTSGQSVFHGGFVAQNGNSCTQSFWDKETSEVPSKSACGTAKTTAQMTNISTFTDTATSGLSSAWDFLNNPNDDTGDDNYWDIDANVNDGYPALIGVGIGATLLTPITKLDGPSDPLYFSVAPVSSIFNCSVNTTLNQLSNISLHITNATNASFAVNQTTTVSGLSNASNWTLALPLGNYTWNCVSYDTTGRFGWGQNRSVISDTTPPTFSDFSNQTFAENVAMFHDINVTDDISGVNCFTVNDTDNFKINCSGYLENNTVLQPILYNLNLTVNDTAGNNVSDVLWINSTPVSKISISIVYPTEDVNVTQNATFNVTINVTCHDKDCGEVNVSLDPVSNLVENGGFEAGNLNSWTTGGDADWSAQDTTAKVGTYAAQGGNIGNNQDTWIYQNITLTNKTTMTFTWKVNSENGFDKLGFCDNKSFGDTGCTRSIDDIPGAPISGNVDWTTVSYDLGPGDRQLLWFFAKDGSVSTGSDTGWIDNVSVLVESSIKGLISTTEGDDPFWTNTTNPYNITLNADESAEIVFWVNATGTINSSHEFFAYANLTSDMSINNITEIWNTTIRAPTNDTTPPTFSDFANQTIEYGVKLGYKINASDALSSIDCFTVNDTTNFNIDCSGDLTNNTFLAVRAYWLNVTVNDSAKNNASDIMFVNVTDTTSPNINIIAPENNTNSTDNGLNVDFTVSDLNLADCWYHNNTNENNATLTNCNNITTVQWPEGPTNITIYVNDTHGNTNSSKITINIDTIEPAIIITNPVNNTNTSNNNHDINYTVSDTNLETCWYHNNTNENNATLIGCSNITTVQWPEGPTNITIYVNDTHGNGNNSKITINVDSVGPLVNLISPTNNSGDNDGNITFKYNVTDSEGIDNCSLIINHEVNITNESITTNVIQNITLNNLETNQYNWTINCTDFAGNVGTNETLSVHVVPTKRYSGNTTDLGLVNISNITNLIIDEPSFGLINFTQSVDLTNNTDIDTYVNISNNRIEVNSTALIHLNTSATLILRNLTLGDPRILRDDLVCPAEICTELSYVGGDLEFNVTHFTVYTADETPVADEEEIAASSGGGGGGGGGGGTIIKKDEKEKVIECYTDSDCKTDFTCFQDQCVKLFDIKLIDIDSPLGPDGMLNFTYFIKGMAKINGDVTINFWLEKDNFVISSGQDVIYMGEFEEKTETTKIFIPKILENGSYNFYVKVTFDNYEVQAHRTVFVEEGNELKFSFDEEKETDISAEESKGLGLRVPLNPYIFVVAFVLVLLTSSVSVLYLERKKLKGWYKVNVNKLKRPEKKNKYEGCQDEIGKAIKELGNGNRRKAEKHYVNAIEQYKANEKGKHKEPEQEEKLKNYYNLMKLYYKLR